MSVGNFENACIVRSAWLEKGGRRLDCNPYMSGALEAYETVNALKAKIENLHEVTSAIFDSGRESRKWVDAKKYGIGYMGTSAINVADLSYLPLISRKQVRDNPRLPIKRGWSLITRSGTVGRMAYVRPDMEGLTCSEDVLRVVPDDAKILSGYLYAYLASKYGVPLVVAGTYGAIIQHIEPEHIRDLPVPRFDASFESAVNSKIEKAAQLLSDYQSWIQQATDTFFSSVGLKDLELGEWNDSGADTGFSVRSPDVASLRALNFNPRFSALVKKIKSGPYKKLNDICLPGTLARGGRFRRVDAHPDHAYQMVGQKELFWIKPEGRWVAKSAMDENSLGIPGAVMIAAQGTLGESELYCRAEFIWGPWTELAFSEHILRVISDESIMPRGCLFAFMRSETAFRMLRSISVGSKLQDHHYKYRGELPVPYPEVNVQHEIHEKVVSAYEARHKATAMTDEAIEMVEQRIAKGE